MQYDVSHRCNSSLACEHELLAPMYWAGRTISTRVHSDTQGPKYEQDLDEEETEERESNILERHEIKWTLYTWTVPDREVSAWWPLRQIWFPWLQESGAT